MEIKYKQVPFGVMLKCDGTILCEHFRIYGIDVFRKPMYFNEFLEQLGKHVNHMGCQSVLQFGEWYVIDDGIQTKQEPYRWEEEE